jgi:spore coat protein U-like protein
MIRFAVRVRSIVAALIATAVLVLVQHGSIADAAFNGNCSVTTTAITFNSFNPFATSSDDFTGTVAWSCQSGPGNSSSMTIKLSAGNSNPSFTRYMTRSGSTDKLFYNLYTDAGFANIWNATNFPSPTVSSGASGTVAIYGRIPAAVVGGTNDVSPGTYTDTIVATTNF